MKIIEITEKEKKKLRGMNLTELRMEIIKEKIVNGILIEKNMKLAYQQVFGNLSDSEQLKKLTSLNAIIKEKEEIIEKALPYSMSKPL